MSSRILAFAVLFSAPAFAQGLDNIWSPSMSRLEMVPHDSCVAEILIYNDPRDTAFNADGKLALRGLVVEMHFKLNIGPLAADRYTAIPPEGYIAVPPSLDIRDGESDSILICTVESVGA